MDPITAFAAGKAIQGVTRALTADESSNEQKTEAQQGSFDALLRNIISPKAGNSINEEELFAAVLEERIQTTVGDEAAAEFKSNLDSHQSRLTRASDGYVPVEDAANAALEDLVSSGTLTETQAGEIKSQAFRAAQLDGNHNALFDGRGSSNDSTIATEEVEKAMLMAQEVIQQIESGTLTATTAATAAAGTADSSSSTSSSNTVDTGPVTPVGNEVDGNEGFVFKPESEHQKKLVVLLPTEFANNVSDVLLKDADDNIIERGDSSGFANGGREHFRFDRAGQDYPDDLTVEVRFSDGTVKSYEIPDPSERYD